MFGEELALRETVRNDRGNNLELVRKLDSVNCIGPICLSTMFTPGKGLAHPMKEHTLDLTVGDVRCYYIHVVLTDWLIMACRRCQEHERPFICIGRSDQPLRCALAKLRVDRLALY